MVVGELGPLGKLPAIAVFGAVLKPASRCDRLVRGVGSPVSLLGMDLEASNDSGLIPWPPRREARPEGIPWLKDGWAICARPPSMLIRTGWWKSMT